MIIKMVTNNAAFISYHLTLVFVNIQIIFVIPLIWPMHVDKQTICTFLAG